MKLDLLKIFIYTFVFTVFNFNAAYSRELIESATIHPTPSRYVPRYTPTNLTESCKDFIKTLSPAGFSWGWLKSPEKVNQSNSNLIDVFYYFKLVTSAPPVVFFNGGPMSDSHQDFLEFKDLPSTPLVFLDQRGTGCSSAYPYKNQSKAFEYIFWGTTGIVHDAELVRKRLNLNKWTIVGHSYGSYIVQRYLELFPQSIIKAGGNGGGIVNFDPLSIQSKAPNLEMRYEEQFYVLQDYFNKYPQDKINVKKIVNLNLCKINASSRLDCGAEYLQKLSLDIMGFYDLWESIHLAIVEVVNSKVVYIHQDVSYENQFNPTHGHIIALEFIGETINLVNYERLRLIGSQILGSKELIALSESWQYSKPNYFWHSLGDKLSLKYKEWIFKETGIREIRTDTIRKNLEKYPNIEYTMWSGKYDYYSPRRLLFTSCSQIGPKCNFVANDHNGHEYHESLYVFMSPELGKQIERARNE